MFKTAFIRARVDHELKNEEELVLSELAGTPIQAITILYKYVAREHVWPVLMKVPNAKTFKTFKETDKKIK